MYENLIFAMLLIVLSVVLTIKQAPIIGIPYGIFTVCIAAWFLQDASLPVQPMFSFLVGLLGGLCLLANALRYKG